MTDKMQAGNVPSRKARFIQRFHKILIELRGILFIYQCERIPRFYRNAKIKLDLRSFRTGEGMVIMMDRAGKQLLSIMLLFTLLCSSLLFSCRKNDGTEPDNTTEDFVLLMKDMKDLLVVYPDGAPKGVIKAAGELSLKLEKKLGAIVVCKADKQTGGRDNTDVEILIGKCNREASERYYEGVRINDYGYRLYGNKLVIAGGNEDALLQAIAHFSEQVAENVGGDAETEFFRNSLHQFQYSATYALDHVELNQVAVNRYTVVYPKDGQTYAKTLAQDLANAITDTSGALMEVISDASATGNGYEIHIGKTVQASKRFSTAELQKTDFLLDADLNGCIYVYSETADGTLGGMTYLRELLAPQDPDDKTVLATVPQSTVIKADAIRSVRVATYNIKLGGEKYGYDFELLAADILKSGAEIVALQEVDRLTLRNKKQDTMKLLAQYTGYEYYYFAPARTQTGGGTYGNGLLSKYPITSAQTLELPNQKESDEARTAVSATLNIDGKEIQVFAAHCNGSYNIEAHLGAIASVAAEKGLPFVVMGDFNSNLGSAFSAAFPECAIVNNVNGSLITTDDGYALDNLIFSKHILYENVKVTDTKYSDHFMMTADIRVLIE